jgi:hypothetical protein
MYPTAALADIGTIGHSIHNNPPQLASVVGSVRFGSSDTL